MKKTVILLQIAAVFMMLFSCSIINENEKKPFKERFFDYVGSSIWSGYYNKNLIILKTYQYDENADIMLNLSENQHNNFMNLELKFNNILETTDRLETSGTIKVIWVLPSDIAKIFDINISQDVQLNDVYNFKAEFRELPNNSCIAKFETNENLPYLNNSFELNLYDKKILKHKENKK